MQAILLTLAIALIASSAVLAVFWFYVKRKIREREIQERELQRRSQRK